LELVLNPDGTVTAKNNPDLVLSSQDGTLVLVKVCFLFLYLSCLLFLDLLCAPATRRHAHCTRCAARQRDVELAIQQS
jgi:hypothetical protein